MIPAFPVFIKLSVSLRGELQHLLKDVPEDSDHSLASILAWDLQDDVEVSQLDGSVVFILRRYPENVRFLTLVGPRCVKHHLLKLMHYARSNGLKTEIRLVPEATIQKMADTTDVSVVPDRDNFDYIISTKLLSELDCCTLRNVRRKIRHFHRFQSNYEFIDLDVSDDSTVVDMLRVLETRRMQKADACDEYEEQALRRLFELHPYFSFVAKGITCSGKLEAFIILEKTRGYLIGHFWKANIAIPGIYQLLLHECCKQLRREGFDYMNIEEDMGIPGLRQSKSLLNPTFLKKYSIVASPAPQYAAPALAAIPSAG